MTLLQIIEKYTPQTIKDIIEDHDRRQTINQMQRRFDPRRLP